MRSNFLASINYKTLIRWWLVGILIFLPFQRKVTGMLLPLNKHIPSILAMLDEITIVIFFLFAVRELYRSNDGMGHAYINIFVAIMIFSLIGLLSGVVNGVKPVVAVLGTFDYVKYFLVIFIYGAFFRDLNEVKKIFRILLIIAIGIGTIYLIQEIWALTSRYLLGKDITDQSIYIFTDLYDFPGSLMAIDFNNRWESGIYKALYVFTNSYLSGLYFLYFFTLYFFMNKKKNIAVLIPLLSGIFVSVSRMVYTSLVLIVTSYIFKDSKYRKWFIVLIIPVLIVLTYMSFIVADMDSIKVGSSQVEMSFRSYSRTKSVEIWKDNVFLGVGPGMFGGRISINTMSPIYSEYNFDGKEYNFLKNKAHGIDQFWPQIIAETGLVGMLAFLALISILIKTLLTVMSSIDHDEVRDLLLGLVSFFIAFIIYLLGSGLNITVILFTFLAFIGMGFGCSAHCLRSSS